MVVSTAAKFHNIKTVSGKVDAHSIAFGLVSTYWQGDDPFPLKSCLQLTCPLLSMVPMGDVRTHNSRTDSRRIGFVVNLLLYAAMKEFCKSIKNLQSYSHG